MSDKCLDDGRGIKLDRFDLDLGHLLPKPAQGGTQKRSANVFDVTEPKSFRCLLTQPVQCLQSLVELRETRLGRRQEFLPRKRQFDVIAASRNEHNPGLTLEFAYLLAQRRLGHID